MQHQDTILISEKVILIIIIFACIYQCHNKESLRIVQYPNLLGFGIYLISKVVQCINNSQNPSDAYIMAYIVAVYIYIIFTLVSFYFFKTYGEVDF